MISKNAEQKIYLTDLIKIDFISENCCNLVSDIQYSFNCLFTIIYISMSSKDLHNKKKKKHSRFVKYVIYLIVLCVWIA